jgi:uncharacterized protein YyaL (SSP411 family)
MNLLSREKSTYLKQHQDNPVHWFPYGSEAIRKAQAENKPIFLSIGYSTCHWCHVMAHESFEDQATADYLNENFVSIKVDREEHPDLDSYYQTACQIYNGRGGWPLSVFLTPQMRPFFVGTYFPLQARGGMPSFLEVLNKLQDAYTNDSVSITNNAQVLTDTINKQEKRKGKVEFEGHFPNGASILNALKQMQDNEYGGYGDAPKFPHFAFYEWATEQLLEGMLQKEQADFITSTIEKMLAGGIFDQARGGIHRYSVDDMWLVPHFEKMLYDQAGLLKVLSKLSLVHNSPIVLDSLMRTLQYLKAEMQGNEGFYFAAQDADSEGREGLYFSFTEKEFDSILEKAKVKDQNLAKDFFQISKEGNFEDGLNVISLNPAKLAEIQQQDNWQMVNDIKAAILEERKGRIPPITDNKGIASWNFHLVSGLVDVAQYCKYPEINQLAMELLNTSLQGVHEAFLKKLPEDEKMFIRQTTTQETPKLLFENYVSYADMQMRMFEITANEVYKTNGQQTIEFIFQEFFDGENFYTRSLHQEDNEPFENLKVSLFDSSYRSPLATFILLIRKWHTVFNFQQLEKMQTLITEAKSEALMSPFRYGETLRALTYPDLAFKNLSVPRSFLKEDKFLHFLPYFSMRFAIDYHDDEGWEFCTYNACELNGKTIDDFLEAFQPKEKSEST